MDSSNASRDSDYSECTSVDENKRKSRESCESNVLASDEEFGPDRSQPLPDDDDEFARDKQSLAWVPTFKERLGKIMNRFLSQSLKFCISGRMNKPPIINVALPKVRKHISFPLYEDMLNSIIPSLDQLAIGRDSKSVVDTNIRHFWELRNTDFEILNNEWNSYLTEELVPLIQHELRLEVGFRLSLYKLLLHKTGPFVEPHRDSEKVDGMFGTVVIQLPSLYEGGKLIIRHIHRTEEIEFSSATNIQNAFSIFYTASYCDCEHDVLQITEGVRACLVYRLVLTGKIEEDILPSAARLQITNRQAHLSDFLRNSWPNDQKIIYCLSNKYSHNNLSFEKLKGTDRMIGQFFEKYADSCDLQVMIGILKRKKYRFSRSAYKPRAPNHTEENEDELLNWHYYDDDDGYDEIATISDVESNHSIVSRYDDYKINELKPLDNEHGDTNLRSMEVLFESEVVPENCFHDIKPFHQDVELDGSDGVHCTKYYRCGAILVYHRNDLLAMMVQGDAKLSKIESTFLSEFERHKDNLSDETVKQKCLKWSHILMDRFLSRFYGVEEMSQTSKIFEHFLLLDNTELLKKFLKCLNFEKDDLSFVHKICDKHGWSTFSADIISKFGEIKIERRIVSLAKFIGHEYDATHNDADREMVIHSILKELLTKFDYELKHPPHQPWYKYSKKQRTDKTKSFLISLWPIATKVNFLHLVEYAKSKPMEIVVPVLISVGENKENTCKHLWLDIANHFKSNMEIPLDVPIDPKFNWKYNVTLNCHCKHCNFVSGFLQRSYQQVLDFFGKKYVRDHVQQTLVGLANLSILTTNAGALRIKKRRRTEEIESEQRDFIVANLSKLRTLMETTT